MSIKEEIVNLIDENCTFVVYKNNEFEKRSGIGVKPIMECLREDRSYFKECLVADKIIGKAAAMLLTASDVSYVFGKVMSKTAIEVLDHFNIEYSYSELVPYIKNRDNTDKCPLEKAVWDLKEPDEAFRIVEDTIKELMKNK